MSFLFSGLARLGQTFTPPHAQGELTEAKLPADEAQIIPSQEAIEVVQEAVEAVAITLDQVERSRTIEEKVVPQLSEEVATDPQEQEEKIEEEEVEEETETPEEIEKWEEINRENAEITDAPTHLPYDISFTAQICSAYRAVEHDRGEGNRLFDDFLAETLAGEDGMREICDRQRKHKTTNRRIAIRTRYFDDFITECVEDYVDHDIHDIQLVILGAGMDSRAYRLSILANVHKVFEVDIAKVLELKESLLESFEPAHPLPLIQDGEIHCVMTDLIKGDDWMMELVDKGFNSKAPSIWIAEGLFYYFEPKRVNELLQGIASLSVSGNSHLAFSAVSDLSTGNHRRILFKSSMPDPHATLEKAGFKADHIDVFHGPRANYGVLNDDELLNPDIWKTQRAGIYVTATKL